MAVPDGIVVQDQLSGPSQLASAVPKGHLPEMQLQNGQLQHITYLVNDLKRARNTDSVEQKLRQLDEEVRIFRVQLGLQGQDDGAWDVSQSPSLIGTNFVPVSAVPKMSEIKLD